MSAASRRRCWFSLRTMFIFVTLACKVVKWTASQLDWIRERHEYLEPVKRDGWDVGGGLCASYFYAEDLHGQSNDLPIGLWVFGEKPLSFVATSGLDEAQYARVKQLFPEADLIWEEQPGESLSDRLSRTTFAP